MFISKTFIQKLLTIVCLVSCLMGLVVMPSGVEAAGATILFGPSSLTVTAGQQVSTTVMVASSVPVNSVDFVLTFPASLVSVEKIDTSATSFPSMFMGPPQADNAAGTIHFLQSKIGGTTSGAVATVTFQAKAVGQGVLGIKSAKIIANDGKGTDVYSGTSGATINATAPAPSAPAATPTPTPVATQSFKPQATAAPQISSPTHPDQNRWYASRAVTITWTGGGQAYNVGFDQSPTTQLPDQSAGPLTSATTTLAGDGVWYAHVKAMGSAGWSSTSHFKLQVDTVAPANFVVTTDPAGETNVLPKVLFTTTDATSGMDHYEVKVDDADWTTATSPHTVTQGGTGKHTVQVKAVDAAGNSTIAQTTFTLLAPNPPVITSPSDKQLFILGELIDVRGKADPKAAVDLFLNNKKLETVIADAAGNFSSTKSLLLFAGAYKLVAKAVSPEGVSSAPSAAINLTIDARAVKLFGAVWPGWVVLIGSLIIFLLLALAVGTLAYRVWRLGVVWARRVGVARQSIKADLEQLEQTVDAKVDAVMAADAAGAAEVKAGVSQAVATAEQHLEQVSKEMLAPEPWLPTLPILHGKERFDQSGKPAAASSQSLASSDQTLSPLPSPTDASVVFGVSQVKEAKKPESEPSNAETSTPPTASAAPDHSVKASQAAEISTPIVEPTSPTDSSTANTDTATAAEPANSPTPANSSTPTVELEAAPAAPPVDLLAPTIEELPAKTDTDSNK